MKKFLKIVFVVFISVNLYSLAPIVSFYLKKPVTVKSRNENVIERLKKNKDPYFEFIVTSDTGSGVFWNEAATLKLISSINREERFQKIPIDFVVNAGDVTFRGKESHYKNYLKIKSMLALPVIDVIGNHDNDYDNGPEEAALFEKFCGAREFSFADRNSFFIVLDNNDGDFKEGQFAWLEKELEKGKNFEHTFIFMHKPPFNPYQQAWYRVETNPWSYRFLELCDKYGVDIVFSGHENVSRTAKFGRVTYMVCGGGGTLLIQPSSGGGFLNYIVVKVNRDYIDYEIRKVQPPVWEFFVYYMWKDFLYFVQGWLN